MTDDSIRRKDHAVDGDPEFFFAQTAEYRAVIRERAIAAEAGRLRAAANLERVRRRLDELQSARRNR